MKVNSCSAWVAADAGKSSGRSPGNAVSRFAVRTAASVPLSVALLGVICSACKKDGVDVVLLREMFSWARFGVYSIWFEGCTPENETGSTPL
jgi:hypothetical protein